MSVQLVATVYRNGLPRMPDCLHCRWRTVEYLALRGLMDLTQGPDLLAPFFNNNLTEVTRYGWMRVSRAHRRTASSRG
jgi:hypothetical protein